MRNPAQHGQQEEEDEEEEDERAPWDPPATLPRGPSRSGPGCGRSAGSRDGAS
jgi:hypothetical protein